VEAARDASTKWRAPATSFSDSAGGGGGSASVAAGGVGTTSKGLIRRRCRVFSFPSNQLRESVLPEVIGGRARRRGEGENGRAGEGMREHPDRRQVTSAQFINEINDARPRLAPG